MNHFSLRSLRQGCWLWIVLAMGGAASSWAADYGKVELLRDSWGTPHVFAETDQGAMYGLGYATAEDRGFQMTYSLRIIQGRLAESVGIFRRMNRQETSLDNDRKMRVFGFYRAAQRVTGKLDRETVQLLQAYCDGVNDYFSRHRDQAMYLFAEYDMEPEPWTPADCIAAWWHLGQFFAKDGTRDLMASRNRNRGDRQKLLMQLRAQRGNSQRVPVDAGDLEPLPPDNDSAVVKRQDVTPEWVAQTRQFAEQHGLVADAAEGPTGPKFSHAWVVGGSRSTTGAAVLVSDPQTPVRNPSLFYEYHVQGDTFNARGIGVPGNPMFLIGYSSHVAWGVTALGADQADLFLLQTDAEHPDQYFFDNEWRKMTVRHETIQVRGRDPVELKGARDSSRARGDRLLFRPSR